MKRRGACFNSPPPVSLALVLLALGPYDSVRNSVGNLGI